MEIVREGNGYCILVWDGYGSGLVRINPRLLTKGLDIYDNPKNWWSCREDTTDEEILAKHADALHGLHYQIIRHNCEYSTDREDL